MVQDSDTYDVDAFDERIIAIDFEFKDDDHPPHMVGVFTPLRGTSQAWALDKKNEAEVIELISKICSHKEILLGHNLLRHDLELVRKHYPYLDILQKPVIDTLELSPLAFPRWPYHKLVKDYKLVTHSRNHPERDAELSWVLLKDEITALADRAKLPESILRAYAYWFGENDDTGGYQRLFEHIAYLRWGQSDRADLSVSDLANELRSRACTTSFARVYSDDAIDPKAKALSLSWLYGADEFSVLSRWARLRFGQIPKVLNELRDTDCGQPDCEYCRGTFDLNSQLDRYFGFPSLRPEQEQVVHRMMQGASVLAILPTGGGKSLCFQLPALINADRRKRLTIIISPLQALMKDQIDNLKAKRIINAAALYSGLTPQERREVLEGIESGKIDLIYIAPEQLRNSTFISKIEQREIASWIIDEAHCVSKWGHDFRPDYLYIPRVITRLSESNRTSVPQVACFTATAKADVIAEIKDVFRERLGIALEVFIRGHRRAELDYFTEALDEAAKRERLIQLLADEPGDAIVYVATQRRAEKVAEALNNAEELKEQGRKASHFHAGVEPDEKKSIQNRFISEQGDLDIIVATNAFGMGVDKPDVRLVVHYDIPGSLECYLQEAGRAGRDRKPAKCILLYSPGDIERQFQLKTMNRITKKDASEILRGIRKIDEHTQKTGDVTVTAGEILMEEGIDVPFEIGESRTETKVKTALAVLEDSGVLRREENYYNVFEVSRVVSSLEEAREIFHGLDLTVKARDRYETVYLQLLDSEDDALVNIDRISHLSGLSVKAIPQILRQMDERGVIRLTTKLVVYLNKGVKGDAKSKLSRLTERQEALLGLIIEKSEGWEEDAPFVFRVRPITSEMQQTWPDIHPDQVTDLLINLRRMDIVELRRRSKDSFSLKVRKSLDESRATMRQFAELNARLLIYVYATIDAGKDAAPALLATSDGQTSSTSGRPVTGSHLRAEFTAEKLDEYLKPHLRDRSREERTSLVNQALLFMNENGILRLGRGLAVLKTAMRVILPRDGKRRTVQIERLLQFYKEQIFQVHVIEAYAEKSIAAIVEAIDFVADYFTLERAEFRRKHFPDQTDEELERPTSKADYHSIVDQLNNPVQQGIVTTDKPSLLVIAGPGSGKTRTLVHRAAYLIKVERVKPSSILIVAFNREAVNEIKTRLRQLVGGRPASLVDVYTYHGIAMRLAGKIYSHASRLSQSDDYFDRVLRESVQILDKADDEDHADWEERRRRLVRGYSHILVDEYQDIDEDCYRLVSAIAGRKSDPESKLSIIAVGDDDQNIYSWKGSRVEYIRRFREEYEAATRFLVENYRSTKAIIATANKLISENSDRIKAEGDHEVRINAAREHESIGGRWEGLDPDGDRGRVTVLTVNKRTDQGGAVAEEILRRKMLDPVLRFADFAILTRTNNDADFVSQAFRRLKPPIPTRRPSPTGIPLPMYREVAATLDALEEKRNEVKLARDIQKIIDPIVSSAGDAVWQHRVLRNLLEDFVAFNGRASVSVGDWTQYLWEYAATQKGHIPDVDAVLVTTIHQAKGKELKHVFLLDPGDTSASDRKGQTVEDERRLYYVGLTRAQELACVMKVQGSTSPFADEVLSATQYVRAREGDIHPDWETAVGDLPEVLGVVQLGLRDIWGASFAREKSKWFDRDKVQALLAELPVGAPLELHRSDFRPEGQDVYAVEIRHEGLKLGSLSQAAASRYQETSGLEVEVGAVIQCWRDEDDKHASLDKYYAVLPRVVAARTPL